MKTLKLSREKLLLAGALCFSTLMTINSPPAFAVPTPASGKYTINWYSGFWGNGHLWSNDDHNANQQYSKTLGGNKNKLNAFEVCNNLGQDAWFKVELFEEQEYQGGVQTYQFWTSQNDCKVINLDENFQNIVSSVKFQGKTNQSSPFVHINMDTDWDVSCHRHWAAGLLSHMVEEAGDTFASNSGKIDPGNQDFLEFKGHWKELWRACYYSDLWDDLMTNAELFTVSTTESNGNAGKTHALVSIADNTAWVAFPGADTSASFNTGAKGGYLEWPPTSDITYNNLNTLVDNTDCDNENTQSCKDVHGYFYKEWLLLEDDVSTWLSDNAASYSNVLITGHSRGGVLAQYMVADLADSLSDIRLVVFGSPNPGNAAFISSWCASDSLQTRFYITEGMFRPTTQIDKGRYEDIITRKKVTIPNNIFFPISTSTYYPRGMSRAVDNYLAGYCDSLTKTIIKTSFHGESMVVWPEYAFTIHGMSFYLTALQDALIESVDL